MKYVTNVPDMSVTITRDDGSIIVKAEAAKLNPQVHDCVTLYGLSQKLADSAASALRLSTENGLDIDQQRESMIIDMWSQLLDGDWTRRGSGGVGRISYLVQAVEQLYKLTAEIAAEKVKSLSEDDRKALTANPKIAALIAKMKAEAAAKAAENAANKIDEDDDLPTL